jgi:hypothetical protein
MSKKIFFGHDFEGLKDGQDFIKIVMDKIKN